MKYCPQCNRQYPDAWITFCTDDGALLREELTPPHDPNWDPRIRRPQTDVASEQATQWLPRDPPAAGAWIAPDERAPMAERPWQPPPPPPRPTVQRQQSGLAVASFVAGIVGLTFGWFCMFPVAGLMAVILALVALGQLRNSPNLSGRGLAIAGLIMGGINLSFLLLWIIWFVLSLVFGS
jgi:hypothetical protein